MDEYLRVVGCTHAQKNFQNRSNHVTSANDPLLRIASRVDYGSQCRGLCEKSTSPEALGLQKELLATWCREFTVNHVKDDVVFSLEVYHVADPDACPVKVAFFALCSALNRRPDSGTEVDSCPSAFHAVVVKSHDACLPFAVRRWFTTCEV